jgi:hypothetical protein
MGTFLFGEVTAKRIDPEAWAEFYDDTIKIIESGQLAYLEWIDVHGIKCQALVPSRNQKGHWYVSGDLNTGLNTETFVLNRNLSVYMCTEEDNGQDIVYCLSANKRCQENRPKTAYFFGAKTQGEPAHIYLLAVLCLAAHRFPEAVAISGDITFEQCVEAQQIVKEILGKDISLPIQYDATALYNRIERLYPQDVTMRSELFFDIYRGPLDATCGNIFQENLSIDVIYNYFLGKNKFTKNIENLVREWLELGLPLDRLCALVDQLGKSVGNLTCILALGKVHEEKKDAYDEYLIPPGADWPEEARNKFIEMCRKSHGFQYPLINAYIPEEEIVETLKKFFPALPVSTIWSCAKEAASETTKEISDKYLQKYYNDIQKLVDNPPPEQYDFYFASMLYYWEPGDTIDPELEEEQLEKLRAILANENKLWNKLEGLNADQRFSQYAFLLHLNASFPEPILNDMYAHVMDERQGKHDWALVNVDTRFTNYSEFVNLMGINRALFQHLCEKLELEKNETNN